MNDRSDQNVIQLMQRLLNYIPHARLQNIKVEALDGEKITVRLPRRDKLIDNPILPAIHGGVVSWQKSIDSPVAIARAHFLLSEND